MINRTETARSKWQDIQAWAQKFRTDPKTASRLTDEQLNQVGQILGLVEGKQNERGAAFDEARRTLNQGYADTSKHRQAWETLQGKLRGVNAGEGTSQKGAAGGIGGMSGADFRKSLGL